MERGSERLVAGWRDGGFALDEELVERVLRISSQFDIDDWYIAGQPKPDLLRTSFAVKGVDALGPVVQDLVGALDGLGLGRAGGLRVFPRGIPADVFHVELQVGAR
ncbi:hypothetical protein Cfla_0900 [Cellulomonas flavigena DSM 20109]|uniref:Uncharacterized protein n=1 Tax=Cellulomonas flavigena (strain ATCC 482 / DSM 20109 / BCRC 11376 / JCM 18109 / NBRC 3775 / NCIMB 8073 / NRS 134) TaxID=446466 RepID=D5UK67_CELFN|nr:hypothetical protein [Cellulomonas flavigena]ADG73809.1 hypothetical protein Cfla_0900 [Cellulomonas flavigena DSM 20109]